MKQGNRISASIAPEDKNKLITDLKELQTRLDFLVTLQPDESRGLRNIGIDGVPYALAGLDAVRASVEFTRRSFDLAEYEKDVALFRDLAEILAVLRPLVQKLEDTYRLVGADVMVTADDIYEDLGRDNGETAAVQAPLRQMRKRYQYRNGEAAAARAKKNGGNGQ